MASCVGVRHIQILFASTMLFIALGMRAQFSVGVVAMTEPNTSSNPDIPVYNWSDKNIILSSFFWGYIVFQIFAGNCARIFGTKYVLIGSMLVNSTALCLTPLMSEKLGSYGMMGCNFVNGLAQGFYFPCLHVIFSKWCPPSERGTLNTLAFAGSPMGTIIGMPIAGFLSSSWVGWPAAFYLYGCMGYAWVLAHFIFGESSPETCRYISEEEKKYLFLHENKETKKTNIPWKAFFTNIPLWTLFITQLGEIWSYTTLLTELPNYINKVMKFDINANSLLSSAPFLANFVLTLCFGRLVDYIIARKMMNLTTARKFFTIIANFCPAITLLVLGFLPDTYIVLSIILLIVTIGLNSASTVGSSVNFVDLTPNFAGLIFGIINTIAHFLAIFGPAAVHLIVIDETDKSQWLSIFIMTSMWFFIPAIIYMFFGSAERQPFDSCGDDDDKDIKTNQFSKADERA